MKSGLHESTHLRDSSQFIKGSWTQKNVNFSNFVNCVNLINFVNSVNFVNFDSFTNFKNFYTFDISSRIITQITNSAGHLKKGGSTLSKCFAPASFVVRGDKAYFGFWSRSYSFFSMSRCSGRYDIEWNGIIFWYSEGLIDLIGQCRWTGDESCAMKKKWDKRRKILLREEKTGEKVIGMNRVIESNGWR